MVWDEGYRFWNGAHGNLVVESADTCPGGVEGGGCGREVREKGAPEYHGGC